MVSLRPPQPADIQDRLACGRSAELVRMYGGDDRHLQPLTLDQAEHWYEQASAEPHGWMIEVDGKCIGQVRLHCVDEANQSARFAIGIFNPDYWSKGLGTRATKLILRYAFELMRLHRVALRVLAYNHRAIACYKKCGFVQEGIERERALVAGEWQDEILMSILAPEYTA